MKGEVFEEQNGKWSEARTHNKSRQKFEKCKYWNKYYAKNPNFKFRRNILSLSLNSTVQNLNQWRIQDFPEGRGANLLFWHNFCRKLHKIMKKNGLGVCIPQRLLDPPLLILKYWNENSNKKKELPQLLTYPPTCHCNTHAWQATHADACVHTRVDYKLITWPNIIHSKWAIVFMISVISNWFGSTYSYWTN